MSDKRNLTLLARLRPRLEGDEGVDYLAVESTSKIVASVGAQGENGEAAEKLAYEFDGVYDRQASNAQVFREQIDPLVSRVIQGYNSVVLSYGATRTGKTHTLFGSTLGHQAGADQDGLVQLAVDSIFNRLETQFPGAASQNNTNSDVDGGNSKYLVIVSIYDVFNTLIIDLLNPNTKTGLNLVDHRSAFGSLVDNAAEIEVSSSAEFRLLLKQALAVHDQLESRLTSQIGNGRAHTFVDVRVEVAEQNSQTSLKYATLRFCSPAGSGGVALKFNAGLLALSKVIDSYVSDKEKDKVRDHLSIPFSSSRLTRLLEPIFGGNTHAVWITNLDGVDPGSAGVASGRSVPSDSIHSLDTAEKLKRIRQILIQNIAGIDANAGAAPGSVLPTQSITARVNKNTLAHTIRDLREEIKKARGRLQLSQPGLSMHEVDAQSLKQMKMLVSELERVKQQTWDRKRQRSRQMMETRRRNLEQEGLLFTLVESAETGSKNGSSTPAGSLFDVPPQLVNHCKLLLKSLVNAKQQVDDAEQEVNEKRNVFKLRMDVVQRKAVDQAANINLTDLIRSDEKLTKFDRQLMEAEEKLRVSQTDLVKVEDEYRKVLVKVANIEAKQKKDATSSKDVLSLEKLSRSQEWSHMKKEIETDPEFDRTMKTIDQNLQQQKDQVNALVESRSQSPSEVVIAQLKNIALTALDSLKEKTAQSKQFEWEKDQLWGRLLEAKYKQEIQWQRYQEQVFFLFRSYRSHFEEQRTQTEARYRELVEQSVKDALKLADENQRLKALLDQKLKSI